MEQDLQSIFLILLVLASVTLVAFRRARSSRQLSWVEREEDRLRQRISERT